MRARAAADRRACGRAARLLRGRPHRPRRGPADDAVIVTGRVLGGVGVHPGAVDRDHSDLDHPGLGAQAEGMWGWRTKRAGRLDTMINLLRAYYAEFCSELLLLIIERP